MKQTEEFRSVSNQSRVDPSKRYEDLPPSKRAVIICYVKIVAQCSETNEKTILGFLVFEIRLILYSKCLEYWQESMTTVCWG